MTIESEFEKRDLKLFQYEHLLNRVISYENEILTVTLELN